MEKPDQQFQLKWKAVALVMIMVCASVLGTAYAVGSGSGGNSIPVVIESGSGVETASYIIYKDGDHTCLKDGTTGKIEARDTNTSLVLQNAIDSLAYNGTVYICKTGTGDIFDGWDDPNPPNITVDYELTYPITVNPGVSIIADNVIFDVRGINDTVFDVNPSGEHWFIDSKGMTLSGLVLLGDEDESNTVGIKVSEYPRGIILDNIKTNFIDTSVVIYGAVYHGKIQNCIFTGGDLGVYFDDDPVNGYANGFSVVNTGFESIDNAGLTIYGAGVSVSNCYFESNGVCVQASNCRISDNYFAPGINNIGINITDSGASIIGNSFSMHTGGRAIVQNGNLKYASVQGNYFYLPVGSQGFNSTTNAMTSIVGNTVNGGGTFINAVLAYSSISSNSISGGNPAILLNGAECTISSNQFYSCTVGLWMRDGYYSVIDGNTFTSGTTDYKQTGGGYHRISNNIFMGTTKVDKAGGNNPVYESNRGWITEAWGTATILSGGTSIVVTHGMQVTPNYVYVTGTNGEVAACYVTGIGATTFQINVGSAVSSNRVVYWYAEY